MPRLPRAKDAILDPAKLAGYVLDPLHPRGRHKARTLRAALGLGQADAEELRLLLLDGVRRYPAEHERDDAWGRRYRVDIPLVRAGRAAVVRTFWIIGKGERLPRFVTCYLLPAASGMVE